MCCIEVEVSHTCVLVAGLQMCCIEVEVSHTCVLVAGLPMCCIEVEVSHTCVLVAGLPMCCIEVEVSHTCVLVAGLPMCCIEVEVCLTLVCWLQAYHSVLQLAEARSVYPEFCIPMTVVPCTISNNVPGSDFSLGCDTALNEIANVSIKLIETLSLSM